MIQKEMGYSKVVEGDTEFMAYCTHFKTNAAQSVARVI